jgi:type II secretory pathway component GspD/PulD (secretin)
MKRLTTLLLPLAFALVASTALGQPAPLPDDPRFDQPVEFATGQEGESLEAMVAALARSVGLSPIVDEVPDHRIFYDIGEPKPFRQVWDLVLRLNELVYVLQPNDVVVVGTAQALAPLLEPAAEAPEEPAPRSRRFYDVNGEPQQVSSLVARAVPDVEAEPLPGTNSIVVVATEEQHTQVRDVLDRFDPVVAEPEPEPAEAAEPEAVAEPAAERVRRFYDVNAQPAQVVTLLGRTVPDAQAQTLPGTNSIVVVATEEQHAQVEEVLARFDPVQPEGPAPAPVDLVQRVYPLSNAQAEELATVLQEQATLVSAGTQAEGEEGGGQTAFTVTADPRTNSLVVTATVAVHENIAQLLPELDVPQPQVSIQVRIQEVNRRVVDSFGLDVDVGVGNFAASLLSGGLDFVFDAQQAISGLNIGAVLDTLESQGLSRRVDDSTLTVLNNGTGRMQAGGRIEIQFPSNDGEIATRTIEFGVIIEVSPRIASDGSVILDVSAEVSDILVPLSEGGIPERIDFSTREVTSTVSLRPGQTVLLGGLLQNSFSRTQSSIPILGDIPILGALFGQTELEDENTEILLVVNADVVD